MLGGHITIGPFLISIGGKGVARTIFLFLVNFFRLAKLIVEIRLIIFLLLANFNFDKILLPTLGVIPNIIIDDLGITPNVGSKILSKLKFTSNKKIISLISTINLTNLKRLTRNKNIVRATPLPPIEIKKGPIVICPPNKTAKNLFKHLGEVIEIRNEKLSNKFWATASIMAAYYEILNTSTNWLIRKGINKNLAQNYIAELFLSLSQDAVNKRSQGFKKLVAESQTPKGLNMQVLNELKRGKFFSKFAKALENVNKRVSK